MYRRRGRLFEKRETALSCTEPFWKIDRCEVCKDEPNSLDYIECQLKQVGRDIEDLRVERDSVISKFNAELRERYKIDLSDEQAATILYGVNRALVFEGQIVVEGHYWLDLRSRGEVIIGSAVILDFLTRLERQWPEGGAPANSEDVDGTHCGIAEIGRLVHFRMLERHTAN